ncbi:MAG: glutamine--fructose-6-phosphate transaminase (isomerizing) [Dehalococcoidales bacterium]|nr:glutamine--fructose-6-phosphate transaminase (isomerizing) [Dehalococcoidales bacterium]
MCGIVGYIGEKQAQPVLIKAMKRLEYRGYDSSGIAISDGSIHIAKDSVRVEALEKNMSEYKGNIGIGHTRWATHGEPCKVNAHPHTDCKGKVAVVHNGVISNYHRLKETLIKEGHCFLSETDTEVISHLIEKHHKGDLEEAVKAAIRELEGTYAIAVISENESGMIVAKSGSPLVIGIGDREHLIASDITPLLDYTNRVIYLDDGEIGVLTQDGIKIKKNDREVSKKVSTISWCAEDAQKCGYEHFMLKEIYEQPKVIRECLADFHTAESPEVDLEFLCNQDAKSLLILACGTSYHAGLVGKYLIEDLLTLPVRVELASEVNHRERAIPVANVIAVTQSGETADVLISMKKLKDAGSCILAITNVRESSASRMAHKTIYTKAGPELSVAATKTFMAQLVALYKVALSQTAEDKTSASRLSSELKQLPDLVQRVLNNQGQVIDCAKYISRFSNVFFIGRGINHPIALEGALKLKEISYIFAEGYAAGELKHGPFSLLQDNTPVVAIVNKDFTYDAMLTNIKEVKSRKSPVIAVAREDDYDAEKFADMVIKIPATHSLLNPVLNTVVVQLIAYYAARERGCPVDFPRNLAKSVTVE